VNEVTMYFAGCWDGKASPEEYEIGVRNKLCSFVYPKQFESWMDVSGDTPGKVLIDSGAFSAWNKGDQIDFEKYIRYCHGAISEGEKRNKIVRVVNLDVIPGKKGETINLNSSVKKEDKAIIEKAAEDGYKNLCRFLEDGITPIHVFHQGEHFKWLDKMVEKTDYIGISPANDVPPDQKKLWMDRAFSYLAKNNIKVKTHGFAVFGSSMILEFPWTSCDAATWRIAAGFGCAYFPVGGYKNPDFSKPPVVVKISDKQTTKEQFQFYGIFEEELQETGYTFEKLSTTWEERCRANMKFFLHLEKWINEKKKTLTFKPKSSIFSM